MHEAHEDALRRDLQELNRQAASFHLMVMADQGGPSALEHLEMHREDVRRRLRKNPLGVRHLIETVDEAIVEIRDAGKLSENMRTWPDGRKEQERLLELLQGERRELEQLLKQVDRRSEEAVDAARADASLPSDQDMLRIHRYETMYERQLYQAINQLERLQRRRLGELSAPPISVSVTRED
jgi:hypothetical protein